MKKIWAPWRAKYLRFPHPEKCIFCSKPNQKTDKKNFVLYRGKLSFIIFNIFPYNNGHLMVAPYRHTGNFEELNFDEIVEINNLIKNSIKSLKKILSPHGFNIGMNIGKVSGAGFDEHLHFHIVPRWQGDSNFMPVLADTKVISFSLSSLYDKLKPYFKSNNS